MKGLAPGTNEWWKFWKLVPSVESKTTKSMLQKISMIAMDIILKKKKKRDKNIKTYLQNKLIIAWEIKIILLTKQLKRIVSTA